MSRKEQLIDYYLQDTSYQSPDLSTPYPEITHKSLDQLRQESPKVDKAYLYAEKVHEGQKRHSNEPFFEHSKAVANIIIGWYNGFPVDEDLVCAGLLHDTVEDNPDKDKAKLYSEMYEVFGETIGHLVEGVSQFKSNGEAETDIEYLHKQAAEGDKDVRIFVLKLADRLHNMRTLQFVPEKKRAPKARETYTYSQLAERLGMWVVKREMEDLAFKYDQPKKFEEIKNEVDEDPRLDTNFELNTTNTLQNIIHEMNLDGTVKPRKNGIFALHEKREQMAKEGRIRSDSFGNINDLTSFRVIIDVDESEEINVLYSVLGQIQNHPDLKPYLDLRRLDDFIADETENKYSGLQTTFNFAEGATEIAIVTKDREEFNNWGVMSYLRRGNVQEAEEKYDIKIVFNSVGKAHFLDKRASGIDYAYSISPYQGAIAEKMIVDGVEMSLSGVVPNAATIEIINSDEDRRAPSEYHLNILPKNKKAMDKQFDSMIRDVEIENGKLLLEPVLAEIGLLDVNDWPRIRQLLITRLEKSGMSDVYFAISRSGDQLLDTIRGIFSSENISKKSLGLTTIRLRGSNALNIDYHISKMISKAGADIRAKNTESPITEQTGKYGLRILIHNLSPNKMMNIRRTLSKDPRFDEVTIV